MSITCKDGVYLKNGGDPLQPGASLELGSEMVTLDQYRDQPYKGFLIRAWAIPAKNGGFYALSEILRAH